MHDEINTYREAKQYEGSNFATEKALATIYVVLFLAVVGLGAHKQLDRIAPEGKSFAGIEHSIR